MVGIEADSSKENGILVVWTRLQMVGIEADSSKKNGILVVL